MNLNRGDGGLMLSTPRRGVQKLVEMTLGTAPHRKKKEKKKKRKGKSPWYDAYSAEYAGLYTLI